MNYYSTHYILYTLNVNYADKKISETKFHQRNPGSLGRLHNDLNVS